MDDRFINCRNAFNLKINCLKIIDSIRHTVGEKIPGNCDFLKIILRQKKVAVPFRMQIYLDMPSIKAAFSTRS